jgi:hypothetical protein
MNNNLRFGCAVSFMLALVAQLTGCDSAPEAGAACASAAECPTGQTCSAGVCTAPGSGSAGSGSNVAGSGGSPASAGSAGNAPSAGNAGTPAAAGSGGIGNVSGSSSGGVPNQAGSSSVSGSSSGGAGGGSSGGAGGSGGTPEPPITVGMCKDDFLPPANNGSVTRYDFAQGTNLPACAYVITHKGAGRDGDWDTVEGISTGDGGYFGAMNTTDYAQGAACGACVEASYNGKKVVLTIVDECPVATNPVCQKGHIDLSRKAIRQLEPNGSQENLKGVSWKYVKCPAAGNVKARLHPNQNADWQPIVIENGLYPLKSVTLNGMPAARKGNPQGGNAWEVGGVKAPYRVRAVDVNNNGISFDFPGGANLTDVGLQFMCQ